MSSTCDLVVERVALGEPLGDVADHAASCPRCRRVAALPAELGTTHRELDPGIGFSSRMTAGAQHRIVVRRRRRIAVGLSAAVAATTLGVFVVTREPERTQLAETPAQETPAADVQNDNDPWKDPDDRELDEDVEALVRLADTERASQLSADWGAIEKPLAPYRAVVEGVEP